MLGYAQWKLVGACDDKVVDDDDDAGVTEHVEGEEVWGYFMRCLY